MLVENTQSNHRKIGKIILGPGINEVDKRIWDEAMRNGYERSVRNLVDKGILDIKGDERLTIALVKNTYDVHLMRTWLEDAKGPLKGAIKKQIASIIGDEAERKEA